MPVAPRSERECDFTADCPAVPKAYAACAQAKCRSGKCVYLTFDSDGDGRRSNKPCLPAPETDAALGDASTSDATASDANASDAVAPAINDASSGPAPLTVEVGDDCDDSNSDLFPGHPTSCAATDKGIPIAFPGGKAKGQCKAGTRSCTPDGKVTPCIGAVGPQPESCTTDQLDEDCDGANQNGCACQANATAPCGPPNVGICKTGTSRCVNGQFGACEGAVERAARNCGSPSDNDCDGTPDNTVDATCQCVPGSVRACNTHPGDGRGVCRAGSQTCVNNTTSTFWGACAGDSGPSADSCAPSGPDANCDGVNGNGPGCTVQYACDIQYDWFRGDGCAGPVNLLPYQPGFLPVVECSNGGVPATIYLSTSGCYVGFLRRNTTYCVSPTSGGAGWIPFLGGYTLQ
jgi:hypothetical protein